MSSLGEKLKNLPWMPATNGIWSKPSDLALEDLPVEFDRNHQVAAQLGMKQSHITALAADNGVEVSLLQGMLELARSNPEAARTWLRNQEPQSTSSDEIATERRTVNVTNSGAAIPKQDSPLEKLVKAFIAPGQVTVMGEIQPRLPINNPTRYRTKLAEQFRELLESERPKVQRSMLKLRRVWDDNSKEVRDFLYETYRGKCQITGNTFAKRADGQAYFEVWYILSTQDAEWLDHPGNALCMCPEIWAKLEYGTKSADFEKLLQLIPAWRSENEGGGEEFRLPFQLCGEPVEIKFTASHMMRLQECFKETPEITQTAAAASISAPVIINPPIPTLAPINRRIPCPHCKLPIKAQKYDVHVAERCDKRV